MSKLSTPALSLDGEQLTISNIDDNATSVQLKKDGANYKNLFSINDTYTNVTASTHDSLMASGDVVIISLTADGTNYKVPTTAPTVTGCTSSYTRHTDTYAVLSLSNPTSNVSFTVVGESAGVALSWLIKDTPTISATASYSIAFVSNGQTYESFVMVKTTTVIPYTYQLFYTYTEYDPIRGREETIRDMAYSTSSSVGGWTSDAYKTVTFTSEPSGDLLTWLINNATPMS